MSKFTFSIDTDNAAFEDCPTLELASILRQLADKVEYGSVGGNLFDSNGNDVGTYKWSKR